MIGDSQNTAPLIEVDHVSFQYATAFGTKTKPHTVLQQVHFRLPAGARVLLVGGNGAGKSTLLRLLAGKHLIPDGQGHIRMLGRDAFRDTLLNNERTYVSAEWGSRTVAFSGPSRALTADIAVEELMTKLQAEFPTRRTQLLQLLRIDPKWRMHQVSDGQRRRVQLFLALLQPSKVILLDEVLGLLDVLSRQDFLNFLQEETNVRGATIVLATNVFDGLEEWTSHLMYLREGRLRVNQPLQTVPDYLTLKNRQVTHPLYRLIEQWLRQELQEKDPSQTMELAAGDSAADRTATNAQISAGGFAPGRLTEWTAPSN